MKNISYIDRVDYKRVKKTLSKKRFNHTIRVLELALHFGKLYKVNSEDIFLASIYHDYAKEWTDQELLDYMKNNDFLIDEFCKKSPYLLHGIVAAKICESSGWIANKSVLNAIAYHTTGTPQLDDLGKIIYLADALEPGRNFDNIDLLREIAYQDLDLGVIAVAKHTIKYLENNNLLIHDNTYKLLSFLKNCKNESGGNNDR